MRTIKILFFFLIICLTVGCKKSPKLLDITFDIKKSETNTIPRITFMPPNGVLPKVSSTVDTKADFKNNGTDARLIKKAELTKINLTIPENVTEDFGFMKNIEITVSSPENPQEVILAQLQDIPANAGKNLELISSGISLVKYIKDSEFSVHLKVTIDETTSTEIPITLNMVYTITANLLER